MPLEHTLVPPQLERSTCVGAEDPDLAAPRQIPAVTVRYPGEETLDPFCRFSSPHHVSVNACGVLIPNRRVVVEVVPSRCAPPEGKVAAMELTLSFSIVRCTCGAERQAEQPCPTCGCDPVEVDEALEQRRQLVASLDLVSPPPPEVERVDPDEVWRELGGWLSNFMDAYECANDGSAEEAGRRIQGQINELAALRARVSATQFLSFWLGKFAPGRW